ncbi:UNVERIFIED_CONTAM: hypothetical protein Sangu_1814000 [Sesamum angustifolium]|uniref:Dilute domain-containing protein n=1 Tax=Sesamum angustifolium TaxID=2727405 RepID=A0AAW2M7I5_9LAMI
MSVDNSRKGTVNSNSANTVHSPASQEKGLQPEDVQLDHANASPVNIGKQRELKDGQSDDQITTGELSDFRSEWKTRIQMLEEELREAAAAEIGLYSIIAEHASSVNKVHAPARRLSRFYSNACKAGSQIKRASAARAAVSGLVLVSKSCGNDVPRLTFWLSNVIMLRAIVSQIAAELPYSNRPESKMNGTGPELTGRFRHKRADFSHVEGDQSKSNEESEDWEDVWTFILALENVESWLFSRIVESVWWQSYGRKHSKMPAKGFVQFGPEGMIVVACLCCLDCNKSIDTWNVKMLEEEYYGIFCFLYHYSFWRSVTFGSYSSSVKLAFKYLNTMDPEPHPRKAEMLYLNVMEQLVNRLDVAMFNAVLRESAEEMPTDPLSDPISDSKVLPILPGKSSFGAGVELKNAVCPMLGPTIIKRVLDSFVPDEFCPDPLPQGIIEALDTEEVLDSSGDLLTSFPCTASPTKYTPPPAALLTCAGEVGSQVLQSSRLSTLRKSYTSDDELDELDSPFTSIIPDSFQSSALAKLSLIPKEKGGRNVLRYQLLREIWKDNE